MINSVRNTRVRIPWSWYLSHSLCENTFSGGSRDFSLIDGVHIYFCQLARGETQTFQGATTGVHAALESQINSPHSLTGHEKKGSLGRDEAEQKLEEIIDNLSKAENQTYTCHYTSLDDPVSQSSRHPIARLLSRTSLLVTTLSNTITNAIQHFPRYGIQNLLYESAGCRVP